MTRQRVLCFLLVFLLLLFPQSQPSRAWEELQIYDYHLVPPLNVTYVEVEPGESMDASWSLGNAYNFSIENVVLTLELYRYRTLKESKDAADMDYAPTISNENRFLIMEFENIDPGENISFTIPVRTNKRTPQATYLIRSQLEFQVGESNYTMKSRGHFSQSEWSQATENRTIEKEVAGENITTGGIDLDILGVAGIMPDTSITVYRPFSKIPLVFLAGITGFVGLCALVFYLQEERNMFPRAEWAYQRVRGKWITAKFTLEEKLKKNRE